MLAINRRILVLLLLVVALVSQEGPAFARPTTDDVINAISSCSLGLKLTITNETKEKLQLNFPNGVGSGKASEELVLKIADTVLQQIVDEKNFEFYDRYNKCIKDFLAQYSDVNRARFALSMDIIGNFKAMDSRIKILNSSISSIKKDNDPTITYEHRRDIFDTEINSLRRAFAQTPLKYEFGDSIVNERTEIGFDYEKIKDFYSNIAATDAESNVFLDDIKQEGKVRSDKCVSSFLYILDFDLASIVERSHFSYLSGEALLRSIVDASSGEEKDRQLSYISDNLNSINLSYGNNLMSLDEINKEYRIAIDNITSIVAKKKEIMQGLDIQIECEKDTLKDDIIKDSQILSGDSWQVVYAKARTLRHYGLIKEAVEAFSKYGEMFQLSDPTAARYALTAKAFTQSISQFGLDGGCYVFEVRPGGPEAESGLQVGDIIYSLDNKTIQGMGDLSQVNSSINAGNIVPMKVLRFNNVSGAFDKIELSIKIAAIIRGVMPI